MTTMGWGLGDRHCVRVAARVHDQDYASLVEKGPLIPAGPLDISMFPSRAHGNSEIFCISPTGFGN